MKKTVKTKTKKGTVKITIPYVVEAQSDVLVDALVAAHDQILKSIKTPKRVKVVGAKVVIG